MVEKILFITTHHHVIKEDGIVLYTDVMFGKNSTSNDLRRINRNIDKKKRKQFRKNTPK